MTNINLNTLAEQAINSQPELLETVLLEYISSLDKDQKEYISLKIKNQLFKRIFQKKIYITIIFLSLLAKQSFNNENTNELMDHFVQLSLDDDDDIKYMKIFYMFRFHIDALKLSGEEKNKYEKEIEILIKKLQETEN